MSDGSIKELRGPHIGPEELVLRLVWDSADIDPETGEIATSAISRADLAGLDVGVSTDRKILASKPVIMQNIEIQFKKAAGREDLKRNEPLLATALTDEICKQVIADTDGLKSERVFAVISTPTQASEERLANPAHAEIVNISSMNKKKSDLNKIRTKLQPLFSKPEPVDSLL